MRMMLILSVLLASCAGGGGGAGDGGDPGAQRAVPGGSVSLKAAGGGFTVSTTVPDVASIAVLAGSDYETAVPVTMSNAGSGAWRGSGIGGGILVRLTLADGSVIETGSGDFTVR